MYKARVNDKPQKRYIPSREKMAVCDAQFVTIVNGKRVIREYKSGQRFEGRLPTRQDGML